MVGKGLAPTRPLAVARTHHFLGFTFLLVNWGGEGLPRSVDRKKDSEEWGRGQVLVVML